MFGNVVLEIPKDAFEHEFEAVKKARGAKLDTDLDETALREVVERYKKRRQGRDRAATFRRIRIEQLHDGARRGVPLVDEPARDRVPPHLRHPRSHRHRGQRADDGVRQHRRSIRRPASASRAIPATGAKEFYGEFLINAQGEDVVAGIRTPQPIRELEQVMPKAYKQLREITTRLEKHYKDVQDFEFTIQDERLFMLQTRSGKRTGYAAVVIATDLVAEKLITPKEAVLLVDPEVAEPAARAGLRSGRVEEDSGRDQGPAGVAGRGQRPGGVHRRPRGRVDAAGQAGDSRPRAKRCPTTSTACSSRRAS